MTIQALEKAPHISTEEQYKETLRALSQRTRPPKLLRLLMGALEKYRQARRIGWSRAHNKVGVTTYGSFRWGSPEASLVSMTRSLLDQTPLLQTADKQLMADIAVDPRWMGFLFVQDIREGGAQGAVQYETATVSLGRIVPGSPRFRDRLDVLLDRPVVAGRALDLSRVRIYVDRFAENSPRMVEVAPGKEWHELLVALSAYYADARYDESKQWSHWTQDYIDYFGPRMQPVTSTLFPTQLDEAYAGSTSQRRLVATRRDSLPPPLVSAAG